MKKIIKLLETCEVCKGSGKREHFPDWVPLEDRKEEVCSFCKGDGLQPEKYNFKLEKHPNCMVIRRSIDNRLVASYENFNMRFYGLFSIQEIEYMIDIIKETLMESNYQ